MMNDQKPLPTAIPPIPPKSAKKPFRISQRTAVILCVISAVLFGGGGLAAKILSDRGATPLQMQEAKRKIPIKKIDWEKTLFSAPQMQGFQQAIEMPLEVETSTQGNPAPFERKKTSPEK